ncbi:MAG: bifunctional diaminohydroxyphosphoribosylaminopyrimidine deaminase/5-amino-6-(5-phosphoribosylamino)uracil reductase RibD [Candidatus Micrarchaeota archaeon]
MTNQYIEHALKLAKKARPSPNPRVGAVIVKNGKIIGEGFHAKFGGDHAEIAAIKSVKNKEELKGAALYVTLEPCSHYEKTPPCTSAIIEAGLKEVIIGCRDKNPKVNSVSELKKKGIEAKILEDEECNKMNESFFHWIKTRKPFVMLKLAMTLDGRIATKTGDSKYISNAQSRALSNSWRSEYDAIMVGINTVLVDNPRLTSRKSGTENPIRIIVDSYLKAPVGHNWIEPNARRIIATSAKHDKEKRKKLEKEGVEVLVLPETSEGHIDLKVLLEKLGEIGITSILVEGGSELATTMLESGLINKIAIFISCQILGNGINLFEGKGVEKMKDAWHLKAIAIKQVQDDVLIEGYV